MHYPVLLGAQATVVALDGHDLNVPTPLPITRFTIAPAQRYDLVFRMPAQGGVQLIDADRRRGPPASIRSYRLARHLRLRRHTLPMRRCST